MCCGSLCSDLLDINKNTCYLLSIAWTCKMQACPHGKTIQVLNVFSFSKIVFIELYVFLHSRLFLLTLLTYLMIPMLPIYSRHLAFFYFPYRLDRCIIPIFLVPIEVCFVTYIYLDWIECSIDAC